VDSTNVNKFINWLVEETNLEQSQMPFIKDCFHKFINENLWTINAEAKIPKGTTGDSYEKVKKKLVREFVEQFEQLLLVEYEWQRKIKN